VTAELVRLATHDKYHRLSFLQRRFEALLGLIDPNLETAATPLKLKAKAAPTRRQLRVDGHAVAQSPAKPNTAVSQMPPRAAMCRPPSIAICVSVR
jgi:hypothetical protein